MLLYIDEMHTLKCAFYHEREGSSSVLINIFCIFAFIFEIKFAEFLKKEMEIITIKLNEIIEKKIKFWKFDYHWKYMQIIKSKLTTKYCIEYEDN